MLHKLTRPDIAQIIAICWSVLEKSLAFSCLDTVESKLHLIICSTKNGNIFKSTFLSESIVFVLAQVIYGLE